MNILIVNPNTTAAMTETIRTAAEMAAAPGTTIRAVNPGMGPASIEGYYDEAFAVPGLLQEIGRGETAGVDGHIIACFDDTGLDAARCLAAAPVVGIGEAAFHLASLIAGRFTVVTTLDRSLPAIEHNLLKYGLERRCARVRAADVPVLDLEAPGSRARQRIDEQIERAKREDGAEAVVLGCAGMAGLAGALSRAHGVPVVEGVGAAVKLVEAAAVLGLRTSKARGYAPPRPKSYGGMLAPFAPSLR